MVFQPRNTQPSSMSVDGSLDNVFTMEVNTNTYISDYALTILNFDNTSLYSGTKTSLSTDLYNGDVLNIPVSHTIGLLNGKNYKWKVRLYQAISNMLITYGVTQSASSTTTTIYLRSNINIKPGMYLSIGTDKILIDTYVVDTGIATVASGTPFSSAPTIGTAYEVYSDFLDTNPEYILTVRETPTVSITNLPTTLTQKYYEFLGEYVQTDNVPLVKHSWNLYLSVGASMQLIKSSGDIFSANLKFYYDGFKTGQTYFVKLDVETEYGITEDSGLLSFIVDYEVLDYEQTPVAVLLPDKSAVQVSWITPTSFEPMSFNTNYTSGLVQSGENTSTMLYLEKGQTIPVGSVIIVGELLDSTISSYNSYTGVALLATPLADDVWSGDTYRIETTPVVGMSEIAILSDNPYLRTNSAQLNNHSLYYENQEIGNLCVMPDPYRVTIQFKPSANFFYNQLGAYNDIVPLGDIFTTDTYNAYGIKLIIQGYKLIALTPTLNISNEVEVSAIAEPPVGEENNPYHIYSAIPVDLDTQGYITFPDYDYVEKISNYIPEINMIVFNKPLTFIPQTGDLFYLNDTLSADFYTTINNTFVLQASPTVISINDYIWMDTETWDDSKYWVEGGTEIERVGTKWWKAEVSSTSLTVRGGGI